MGNGQLVIQVVQGMGRRGMHVICHRKKLQHINATLSQFAGLGVGCKVYCLGTRSCGNDGNDGDDDDDAATATATTTTTGPSNMLQTSVKARRQDPHACNL